MKFFLPLKRHKSFSFILGLESWNDGKLLHSATQTGWKIFMKIFCQTRHFEKISFFEGIHTYFDETAHTHLIPLLWKKC